jgi:hypothetical protein
MAVNLRATENDGISSCGWAIAGFSKRTQLNGITTKQIREFTSICTVGNQICDALRCWTLLSKHKRYKQTGVPEFTHICSNGFMCIQYLEPRSKLQYTTIPDILSPARMTTDGVWIGDSIY